MTASPSASGDPARSRSTWRSSQRNSGPSTAIPVFTASARPARSCRSGSVPRIAGSTSTPAGWWNAPTRFFPCGRSTAVLPPMELSTCASTVVGTHTQGTPRSQVAAANPARSPTTPPPRATTAPPRSRPSSAKMAHRRSRCRSDLDRSPCGTVTSSAATPERRSERSASGPWRAATVLSLTTTARRAAVVAAAKEPSPARLPTPTRTRERARRAG